MGERKHPKLSGILLEPLHLPYHDEIERSSRGFHYKHDKCIARYWILPSIDPLGADYKSGKQMDRNAAISRMKGPKRGPHIQKALFYVMNCQLSLHFRQVGANLATTQN